MSSTPPSQPQAGRSASRVILDIVMLIGIPSAIIYVVSLIWK